MSRVVGGGRGGGECFCFCDNSIVFFAAEGSSPRLARKSKSKSSNPAAKDGWRKGFTSVVSFSCVARPALAFSRNSLKDLDLLYSGQYVDEATGAVYETL